MDGDQGAINKLKHGEFYGALRDVVVAAKHEFQSAEQEFPALGNLVARLTGDAGIVAHDVALAAWNTWEDTKSLLDVAKAAFDQAVTDGKTIVLADIEDWLGIIDRNQAIQNVAGNALSAPSDPQTDSPEQSSQGS